MNDSAATVLPLDRLAVLVIDLQEEHRIDHDHLVDGFEAVLSNAASIIAAARAAVVPVIYAQYLRSEDGSDTPPLEAALFAGRPMYADRSGMGVAICPEVAPRPEDRVFEKSRSSCFHTGDLKRHLADAGIDHLLVCGVWTEACVLMTVMDAVQHDIHAFVVKDACGSGTQAMHRSGILNIANRLYGGGILDTKRAVSLLRGESADIWICRRSITFFFDRDSLDSLYDSL
ncbi:MAG: isochorismatase family protein [Kiloniellales bacterium]